MGSQFRKKQATCQMRSRFPCGEELSDVTSGPWPLGSSGLMLACRLSSLGLLWAVFKSQPGMPLAASSFPLSLAKKNMVCLGFVYSFQSQCKPSGTFRDIDQRPSNQKEHDTWSWVPEKSSKEQCGLHSLVLKIWWAGREKGPYELF